MNACARKTFLLTVLCFALSALSFAATDATLYVAHGIPGRDLGSTINPSLPGDVLLNGATCIIRGGIFGTVNGPFTLPPGDYDIKISPANTLAPCTNAPVAETTATLSTGSTVTVVAALDANASPTLLAFADFLPSVKVGQARVTFAQAADAPAVQVTLTQQLVKHPFTTKFMVNPSSQASVTLPSGTYAITVTASGTNTLLYTGLFPADNQSVELNYIVGSFSNNSVTLLTRIIRDVF
jgi:hypothetical protein